MPKTLTELLAAYLLAEFVFQPKWITARLGRVAGLLFHCMIATAISFALLGVFDWKILLAVFAAHLLTDSLKPYRASESAAPFLMDQTAHLAVVFALAWRFPHAAADGWWVHRLDTASLKWYFATLTCASGLVLSVPAGGVLIAALMKRFTREIGEIDITGLTQGGRYIGWLERLLVMLLLLMEQPNGIGFLIAAKSILRFGEIKDATQRKVAEYIIIGTFLSFGWALLVSSLTQKALKYWGL